MKKILVFGLGFQGRKYVNYFKNKGFLVDGVNKSGVSILNINLFSFDEIIKKDNSFFEDYEYIIVSVKPILEQNIVIEFLINLGIKNKIIIEKPVTDDLGLFEKLIKLENVGFFLDEIILGSLFRKKEFDKVEVSLPNGDNDILEHLIGLFILREDFLYILNKIKINNFSYLDYEKLVYKINFGKYKVICEGGNYFINDKKISINFEISLDFLLNNIFDDKQVLRLFKKNFFEFKLFNYM